MRFTKILKHPKRIGRFFYLAAINFFRKKSIVNPESSVSVSLTSHSDRVFRVFATIESIGLGTLKPNRLILFLGNELKNQVLPKSLERLHARGLEIIYCDDVGPHTKYFPYVAMLHTFANPLVTADDDKMYPNNWLRELFQAWSKNPDFINCFRARNVLLEKGNFSPYKNWTLCSTSEPLFKNFATGVSGVIYPPKFLYELKKMGDSFKSLCPKADDIWLHVIAIRNGYRIRQIHEKSRQFPGTPLSNRSALHMTNIRLNKNDAQISATYTDKDIEILEKESLSLKL